MSGRYGVRLREVEGWDGGWGEGKLTAWEGGKGREADLPSLPSADFINGVCFRIEEGFLKPTFDGLKATAGWKILCF